MCGWTGHGDIDLRSTVAFEPGTVPDVAPTVNELPGSTVTFAVAGAA